MMLRCVGVVLKTQRWAPGISMRAFSDTAHIPALPPRRLSEVDVYEVIEAAAMRCGGVDDFAQDQIDKLAGTLETNWSLHTYSILTVVFQPNCQPSDQPDFRPAFCFLFESHDAFIVFLIF